MAVLIVAACDATAPTGVPSSVPSTGAASPSGSAVETAPGSPTPATTTATGPEVQALRDAALASVADGTVRMIYTVEFKGARTVPDGMFLNGRGQTSFGDPREAHLTANLLNEAFGDWELILEGRELYLKGAVVDQIVPAERWLLVDLDSDHRLVPSFATLASGQNDSSLALLYVLGAVGDVRVGEGESIDGQDTRRYQLDIDLEEATAHVPASSAQALADNIAALDAGGISRRIKADVWVAATGRVVRTRYVYTLGAGENGGSLIGTYGFSDYGAPMDDVTPPAEDVLRLEDAVAE